MASIFVGAGTSLWLVRLFMFGLGVGLAYVFISQQAARFATISPADTGRATALASAIQQASSAAGIALLTTVLTVQNPPRASSDPAGLQSGLSRRGRHRLWWDRCCHSESTMPTRRRRWCGELRHRR